MISQTLTRRITKPKYQSSHRVNPVTARLDKWFKRNAIGEQKESEGKFEDAIRIYEANVAEDADTIFSYERLAILYKRRGDDRSEIRIIRKALRKLNEKSSRKRLDEFQDNQLRHFQRRLVELTGEDPYTIMPPRQRVHGLI